MGEHHARSTATAGRIAGRSALTAATALALTGGTASLAFAAEAPSYDHTAQATEQAVQSLGASAAAAPSTPAPSTAAGLEKLLGDHAADGEHKVADVSGPAVEDTQNALDAHGVPVGDRLTDTQHDIVDRSGAVSERVHHTTGSASASLDRHAARTSHASAAASHEASDDVSGGSSHASHDASDTVSSLGLPSVLSFA